MTERRGLTEKKYAWQTGWNKSGKSQVNQIHASDSAQLTVLRITFRIGSRPEVPVDK